MVVGAVNCKSAATAQAGGMLTSPGTGSHRAVQAARAVIHQQKRPVRTTRCDSDCGHRPHLARTLTPELTPRPPAASWEECGCQGAGHPEKRPQAQEQLEVRGLPHHEG